MTDTAKRQARYDDLRALPENMVGEILGGELLWLVDPDARTLEAYHRQTDGHWLLLVTLKDDDGVRQPPFDAIGFPFTDLWADPPTEPEDT